MIKNKENYNLIVNLLLLGILVLFVINKSFSYADSDLTYILATGKELLHKGFFTINPFTITKDLPIVIQNPFYCILVYLFYKWFSYLGLYLLNLVMILGCIYVIWLFCDKKIKPWLYCSLTFICFFGYINIRPEMFTFILIMLEIYFLENKKFMYLPILTLLEINFHASYWLLHFIVILPYLIPIKRIAKNYIIKIKDLLVPMLLMVISLFINPYGIKNITYVFKSVLSNKLSLFYVSELQSPTFKYSYSILFLCFLLLVFYMLINKKLYNFEVLFFIGFGFLYILAVKWIPFICIAYIFIVREFYYAYRFNINKLYKINHIIIAVLIGFILAIGINIFSKTNYDLNFNNTLYKEENQINKHIKPKSNVIAIFSKGNFFEYKGHKVLFDARPELYIKEFTKNKELENIVIKTINPKKLTYKQITKLYKNIDYDYMIIEKDEKLYGLLNPKNIIYKTKNYVVYSKEQI